MKILRVLGKTVKISLIAGVAAVVLAALAAIFAPDVMAMGERARGLFNRDLEKSESSPEPESPQPGDDAA